MSTTVLPELTHTLILVYKNPVLFPPSLTVKYYFLEDYRTRLIDRKEINLGEPLLAQMKKLEIRLCAFFLISSSFFLY